MEMERVAGIIKQASKPATFYDVKMSIVVDGGGSWYDADAADSSHVYLFIFTRKLRESFSPVLFYI